MFIRILSAFGVTETVPLWMNLKDSSTQKTSISPDTDYFYEYVDYQQDNKSDTNTSTSLSSVSTIKIPIKTVEITHPQMQKDQIRKNNTSPGKNNPVMPPSPSSSGFTFFGVPLPNLNFNLWGHSNRKAERKESSSSSKPNQGRYRAFPPTEPEIHRGGFIPLPRAQSGFVPIIDPRLTLGKHAKRDNITKSQSIGNITNMQQERIKKSGNITKVGKIFSKVNKPQTEFREKEELSIISTLDPLSDLNSFEPHKIQSNINRNR